jgi:hypothetical protein
MKNKIIYWTLMLILFILFLFYDSSIGILLGYFIGLTMGITNPPPKNVFKYFEKTPENPDSPIPPELNKKLSDAVSELEKMKNHHIEVRSESPYDKGMKERMDGGISALEKAIKIVKKCTT